MAKTLDFKIGDFVKIHWLDAGLHNSKINSIQGLIKTETNGEVLRYMPKEDSLVLVHRKNRIDDVTYSVIQISSITRYEIYKKSRGGKI